MTTLVDDLDLGGRLTLDDQMSAALERIGPAWSRATTAFTSGAQAISNTLNSVGARVDGFFSRASSTVGRGFGTLTRSIAAFTGTSSILHAVLSGPVGIAGALHSLARGAMTAGGEIEQLQLAFTTLMRLSGGAEAANRHLAELQRFAVGKPFEFSFLADASRNLQNFGFSAQDSMRMLERFGDVAAGSGKGEWGFRTLVDVSGQIRGMNRMTRGQVSRLQRAGLNTDLVRQNLGLDQSQWANIARQQIGQERILAAIEAAAQQQWGGGMARAAQTLAAKLSDLDDVIGNMRRSIYVAMGPVLIPVIDRFSGFLTRNAEKIARFFALVVNTSVHLVEALVGPIYGALSDMMGRAHRDTHNATGGMIRMMQRAALIIEGVSALIIGDNGRGVTGISAALRDRLVAAGLWPATLAIARFANRVRAFLVGFTEAFIARFTRAAHTVQWFTDRLGITHGVIGTSTARARVLGAQVAALIGYFLTFRTALRFIGPLATAFSYVSTAISYATRAVQFLRVAMWAFGVSGGPVALVIGAVVALGALIYYLSRSGRAVALFRSAWAGVKEVFAPIGALLERAWEGAKQLGAMVGTALANHFRRLANGLRPLLGPLRLIASFVGVTLYLALAGLGISLGLMVRGWLFLARIFITPFVNIGRAIVWLVSMFVTGWAAIGSTIAGWFSGSSSTIASIIGVLRALGAVALWLGRVAFGYAFHAITDGFVEMWRFMLPALSMIREAIVAAFGFIVPYVGPIFAWLRGVAVSTFEGIVDLIVAPLRALAQTLVTIFRALPARLQPAELRGAVETLDSFANGNPATGTGDVMRKDINASKAAPARAANAAAAAATVTAAAVASQPAPTVVVQPAPTVVQIDGREIARTVERARNDDTLRRGGTVSTTR